MGIPEKLDFARIVYTLGLWAPGCLESGPLVFGKLDACTLVAWTEKLKFHFTVKGAVADYDIFNGFSFSKNESILARIW